MRIQPTLMTVAMILTLAGCGDDPKETATSAEPADVVAAEDIGAEDSLAEGGEDSNATDTENPEKPSPDATEDDDTSGSTDTLVEGPCETDADCAADAPLAACMKMTCQDNTCVEGFAEEGSACGDETNLCSPGVGACTGEGECIFAGEAPDCDDGNPCTEDSCEETIGCVNASVAGNCDDGDLCTTVDSCLNGLCIGSGALDCNDDNPCTFDSCDSEAGCIQDATIKEGEPCEDGEACTVGDVCTAGTCESGNPVVPGEGELECAACSDDVPCAQTEDLCDATFVCDNGFCKADPGTAVVCTDDDPCTEDACNPLDGLCTSTPLEEGAACEDGNPCTENTTCVEGVCTGEEVAGCTPGCVPTDSPGCAGCECESCVCDLDPFCCDVYWDASCVNLCTDNCGQDCGIVIDPGECDPGDIPKCPGQTGCIYSTWLGDDYCDASLNCPEYNFDEGDCVPCYPACEGKNCGPDGCGGTCGTCGGDEFCYDGVCAVPCGNGVCEPEQNETCVSCIEDCGECPKGSGCEVQEQPTCGGCACEACVCDADPLCCTTAWDSACVLLCINDCGGCEYDAGCFENYLPAISGQEGSCSLDEAPCTTDAECTQGAACPAPPVANCNGGFCELDGAPSTAACQTVDDCPTAGDGVTVTCEENLCLANGTPMAETCTLTEDCATPEPCVEPELNACIGYVESIPESIAPGCDGCACESCVCEAHPECCDTAWTEECAVACQSECDVQCGIELCAGDIDCFDGNACTNEFCNALGVCEYSVAEGCCAEDSDCEDGNSCTVNSCNAQGVCEVKAAYDAACCPEGGNVFSADFETSIPFTVSNTLNAGGWQISKEQAHSPTHALWYGSKVTGDLNFGNSSGTLTSQVVLLPNSFSLSLSFWVWTDVSAPLSVRTILANGTSELIWSEIPAPKNEWVEVVVDMTPWKGQPLQIQFSFSSGGSTAKGIYLDDVALISDCSYPSCGDAECNGEENCFTCPEDCAAPETCPENDGCTAWEYPGCVGCACEAEVCASQPECCDVIWDSACVTACGNTDVQSCGPTPGCVTSDTPGCDGCACEACVCEEDFFCCGTSWDSLCVTSCSTECGQDCGSGTGGTTGGGTGGCDAGDIPDCNGVCGNADWVGDGLCDDGTTFGDTNFNCAEFEFDAGDCDGSGGGFF